MDPRAETRARFRLSGGKVKAWGGERGQGLGERVKEGLEGFQVFLELTDLKGREGGGKNVKGSSVTLISVRSLRNKTTENLAVSFGLIILLPYSIASRHLLSILMKGDRILYDLRPAYRKKTSFAD